MAIDENTWTTLLTALDTATAAMPGTDPADLDTLRDALETCLEAVNDEAAAQH